MQPRREASLPSTSYVYPLTKDRPIQTFLSDPSYNESARVLDLTRLGKQIIEAGQIVRAHLDPDYGWQHHPVTQMWRDHTTSLVAYARACDREWTRRRRNRHASYPNLLAWLKERDLLPLVPNGTPPWLGDAQLHSQYRALLLAKEPEHYSRFGWNEEPSWNIDYPTPA